jgi:cobalt/nickel transport system permease protein
MKDRFILSLYMALVVAATFIHDPLWLGVSLIAVALSAGKKIQRTAWRSLRAALPFIVSVSLGFLFIGRDNLHEAGFALLRINLRVLLMTSLAFRILPAVNLSRALGFSTMLQYVVTLTTAQVLSFRRLFTDFQLALQMRSPQRVGLLVAIRHGASTAAWFLRRAEHDATELTQAMTTRGFFLDQD